MGIFDKARQIKKAAEVIKNIGSKSQAELCIFIRGYIPVVGTRAARRQVLLGVEKDLRKKVKKNKNITVEELLKPYKDEPEFVKLWHEDLGLEDIHLEEIAREAISRK